MAFKINPFKQKPKRRLWAKALISLLILLVLIIGVAGAAYLWRMPLADFAIRTALDQAGLHQATYKINAITLTKFQLADFQIGNELTLKRADLRYRLTRLPDNPVSLIILDGFQIDLTGKDKTLQKLLAGNGESTEPLTPQSIRTMLDQIPATTFTAITVKNASLRYAETQTVTGSAKIGPLQNKDGLLTLNGHVSLQATLLNAASINMRGLTLKLPFKITHAKDQTRFTLGLDTGPVQANISGDQPKSIDVTPLNLTLSGMLQGDGTLIAELKIPNVSVTEGDKEIAVDDINLSARYVNTVITGKLRTGTTLYANGKPMLPTATLQSAYMVETGTLSFQGHTTFSGASALKFNGRHELGSGNGNVSLTLPALSLTAASKDLHAFLPAISGYTILGGETHAKANLTWGKKGFNGTASVDVQDAHLTDPSSELAVKGFSAGIRFNSLAPPRTPRDQEVRIKQISTGVPLNNLLLRFALIKGTDATIPAFKVGAFQIDVAGGKLKVTPTVIDSAADTNEGIINIKVVDLAAIFTAAGVDGVSGTGRLNGAIPVRMTGKTITITNGRLATAKPGVLKINSETVNQTLARGGPEVVLMLSALRDFHYEKLTLKIEKKPDGEGNLLLHTRGHNPAVRNGQPFIINLNLTGNVDRLAALAAQAFQLPSAVVRAMLPK